MKKTGRGLIQRLMVATALLVATMTVFTYRYTTVKAGAALTPVPIQDPSFPVPAAVIEKWIASNDTAAIRKHGWELWKGVNAVTPSTAGWPVWETWYSGAEIGDQGAGTCAVQLKEALMTNSVRATGRPLHDFHEPEQFHHGAVRRRNFAATGATVNVPEQVTVKFNADYAEFVLNNHYCDAATLWKLQASWGTQPLINRHIQPFPHTAIGLKPTYEFVNGPNHNNGITTVNYWGGDLSTGPQYSTNHDFPTPDTWTQCVTVNTGAGPTPTNLQCAVTNAPGPIKPTAVVGLDQFYHFQLTVDEAKSVCADLGGGNCPVQAGDYAILVAMHMSTKEDDDWTWQTFWWNYGTSFPYGAPPADIPAPFNHYAMSSGYSMTEKRNAKGPNVLAYNPYLETGLGPYTHGVNSNCLSCHTVASLGNNPNSNSSTPPPNSPNSGTGYPAYYPGQIYNYTVWDKTSQVNFYDCMTTTDTSWFVQGFAGSGPTKQAPCILTSALGAKAEKH